MVENVVLVGAGASFGSGGVHPTNPPLGNDLFTQLESQFPYLWGSLPDRVRDEFLDDFEDGMVLLSEFNSTLHAPLYQAMGAYFAQFSLGEDNHYTTLIDGLHNSITSGETVFASLNYDLLLEQAIVDAGTGLNPLPENLGNPGTVIKPHGSCNFLPEALKAVNFAFTGDVAFDSTLEVVSRKEVIEYYQSNRALYPAMALYRPDKRIQLSPSVIEGFQELYQEAVTEASTIGIIGAAFHPQDNHIWDPLTSSDATIHYIGGESSFDRWQEECRDAEGVQYISWEFGDGVDELITALS